MHARPLSALAPVALLLGSLIACGGPGGASAGAGQDLDRVVAEVDGETIAERQLQSAVRFHETGLPEAERPSDEGERREQLRREVLDSLIDGLLIERRAKALGVTVTDAQVEAAIEALLARQGLTRQRLVEELERLGIDLPAYRRLLYGELVKTHVVAMETAVAARVTPAELDRAVRERYFGPEGVTDRDRRTLPETDPEVERLRTELYPELTARARDRAYRVFLQKLREAATIVIHL